MLKKFVFFILLGTFLISLAGCQNSDADKIIFYYSLTCPHCKNVEKYVADNNVKAKVDFIEKEISENKDNASEFIDKAAKCNIKPEEAGVPLLWDGSTCLGGDEPIINYFFTKINEK
jgi:hypothetical protein